MRRIAIINQKGGVGKTTTAVNLGAALARLGRRVLVIDMDPQANASTNLGVELAPGEASTYTVLVGVNTMADAVRATRTPGLAVLPAHLDLSGAELELAGAIGRETILRDALDDWTRAGTGADGVPPVDYVLLDNPPSLGLLSVNGLAAADEVLIAVQTEFFALQGLSKLVEVVQLLRRKLNPKLEITGVLACLYDSRLRLAREVLAELRAHFPAQCFKQAIGKNVKLAECPSFSQTIFEYAPESPGAKDHLRVAAEVVAREARDPELAARALPTPDVEAVERTLVAAAETAAAEAASARPTPRGPSAVARARAAQRAAADADEAALAAAEALAAEALAAEALAAEALAAAGALAAAEAAQAALDSAVLANEVLDVAADAPSGPPSIESDADDDSVLARVELAAPEALTEVTLVPLAPLRAEPSSASALAEVAPNATRDVEVAPHPPASVHGTDGALAPVPGLCLEHDLAPQAVAVLEPEPTVAAVVDLAPAREPSGLSTHVEPAVTVDPVAEARPAPPRALPVLSGDHYLGEERRVLPSRRGPRRA